MRAFIEVMSSHRLETSHWRAECDENRTLRSVEGRGKRAMEVVPRLRPILLPGQQRKRRQTLEWEDAQGKFLAARPPGGSCPCRSPFQEHLPVGSIPPLSCTAWQEEGHGGRRAHHPRHHLPIVSQCHLVVQYD